MQEGKSKMNKHGIGIILGIIGVIIVIWGVITKIKGNVSVSIIGGADGPTSIFVAGKLGGATAGTLMISGLLIAIIGIILFIKKKK